MIAFRLAEPFGDLTQEIGPDGEPVGEPFRHYRPGPVTLPDDTVYDLDAELESGGGTISVDSGDTALVEALRAYPTLIEVP